MPVCTGTVRRVSKAKAQCRVFGPVLEVNQHSDLSDSSPIFIFLCQPSVVASKQASPEAHSMTDRLSTACYRTFTQIRYGLVRVSTSILSASRHIMPERHMVGHQIS